jgi:alpha-tubulin suppressor-like RCC1 family protein
MTRRRRASRQAQVALLVAGLSALFVAGPALAVNPERLPEPLLQNPIRIAATDPVTTAPVAVGPDHACAVVGGTVECWGANAHGQLGDGTRTRHLEAVAVLAAAGGAPITGVSGIAAGSGFTCALLSSGAVSCWGAGGFGQLGNGGRADSAMPVAVAGITTAVSLSAGTSHACAVLVSGAVACWGRNQHGQLGDGTLVSRVRPVMVRGISGAHIVAAGGAHSCATYGADDLVRCWGLNSSGQLGTGNYRDSRRAVPVRSLSGAIALAAGSAHTCAVVLENTWLGTYQLLFCWGKNDAGQVDPGTRAARVSVPTMNELVYNVATLSAGDRHTCATWVLGTSCWGANASGQVGNGSRSKTGQAPTPTLGTVTSVAAGGSTSCAFDTNDAYRAAVWCWGNNNAGQVGDGTTATRTLPTLGLRVFVDPPPVALAGATALAVGSYQACAVMPDGTVRCWGDNSVAELGDSTAAVRSTAVRVRRLAGAATIAAGSAHTCVITTGGEVRCWGYNFNGQIGDGTTNHRSTPVPVRDLGAVSSIAGGLSHTCAVMADATLRCWGLNDNGQLGDGTIKDRTRPVAVSGIAGVTAVAPGGMHTCAVRTDGTAWCWGNNDLGQLGDGTFVLRRTPVQVAGVRGAVAIASAATYSCALLGDGHVTCWGLGVPASPGGAVGSIGLAVSAAAAFDEVAPPPAVVDGVAGATAIGLGDAHACALVAGGTVTCWGDNSVGQLGTGSTDIAAGPVQVTGLSGVTALGVGGTRSCALVGPSATAECWGSGTLRQLGNGLAASSTLPVVVLAP